MKTSYPFLLLALCLQAFTLEANAADSITVEGLITPRDDTGLYVRNADGQFEIEWAKNTRVALDVSTRLLRGIKGGVLSYRVHSSNEVIDFPLPKGPVTGIVEIRRKNQFQKALEEAREEKWISERGLSLHFGKELPGQLPSADDPRFVGLWDPSTRPRTLTIKDLEYELSMKKGGQANVLLYNVIGTDDCKPFVNRARVSGRKKGDVIIADEIHLKPIGDQAAKDDPKLPRYLFIGDSISGNYGRGLREALAGRFNLHHPPTNCGPSGKGRGNIVEWLGGYRKKGRHWDVISFNFGHWDAGNDKATYQENLGAVIAELKKTGAKLIWVSTCPVPRGYPAAGDLDEKGKAPRRTSGVMQKYLNPWALEVVKRHPEITICDQWQYVKDNEKTIYKSFWAGKNVHFGGESADKLGQFLAGHVLKVMKDK